jgi:hypothetical protein
MRVLQLAHFNVSQLKETLEAYAKTKELAPSYHHFVDLISSSEFEINGSHVLPDILCKLGALSPKFGATLTIKVKKAYTDQVRFLPRVPEASSRV